MAHWRCGPWGPNKEYIWVNMDDENAPPEPVKSGVTIMVKPNIAYQSPVTGEAITTWAKRRDDMARSGCMDAREARECAADARRNWKTGVETLTLGELERQRRY